MRRQLFLGLPLTFILSCQKPSSSNFQTLPEASPSPLICKKALLAGKVFDDIPTSIPLAAKAADHDTGQWLRSRAVKVQFAQLQRALSLRSTSLEIFPGENLELTTDSFEQTEHGTWIASGRIQQDPLSSFTFSFREGVLSGHLIPSSGPRTVIRYLQPGSHLISSFAENTEDRPGAACAALEASEAPVPAEEPDLDSDPAPPVALQSTPLIDLLVAYTPAALAKAGSREALQTLIELGISDSNKAYLNSGVNLNVRLVGVMPVNQFESTDFSADLGSLASRSDGRWDEVHAERLRLGADQVTLLGAYPNNSVAGIAYIKASGSSAFSIVKVSSFGNFTFTHELGHNIGLRHTDGYLNQAGAFRTIMAYGSVVRIRRFSNPLLAYKTYATGDSDHNSAAILNSLGATTAGLMLLKTPLLETASPPAPTDPSSPPETETCP